MDKTTIIIIVAVALVVLIALAIVVMRIVGKKKSNKLQDTLKKYSSNNAESDDNLTIANDENAINTNSDTSIFENKPDPIIEDFEDFEDFDDFDDDFEDFNTFNDFDDKMFKKGPMPSMAPNSRRFQRRNDFMPRRPRAPKMKVQEDDDFEQFMNEHAYSRKMVDKNILNNIKDLSPEVKAIILSNVFNKFDEE